VNGILPLKTLTGQVGAVNPGAILGPLGFIPNTNVIADIEALNKVRINPTGAAGAAAASIKVNGVVISLVEVG
jgi:hypothetical protein